MSIVPSSHRRATSINSNSFPTLAVFKDASQLWYASRRPAASRMQIDQLMSGVLPTVLLIEWCNAACGIGGPCDIKAP